MKVTLPWQFLLAVAVVCPTIVWAEGSRPAARLPATESVAVAEAWPSLKPLVRMSVLIVQCQTEKFEGRMMYKVLDVWKGEYSPLAFVRQPPTGYIDTGLGDGGDREAGREVILFFARHNQSQAGISRHDMALTVRDGVVSYPSETEARFSKPEQFSLKEFKRKIKQLVEDKIEETPQPEPAPAKRPSPDFSGSWRLLLPAGFEHQVTITSLDDNRYRLEPRSLNMSGVYEVRGDRLVLVKPREERLKGFEWSVRSPFLMTLVGEASNTGATYRDAVLFRSNDTQGREPNPARTRHAGSELPQLSPRF